MSIYIAHSRRKTSNARVLPPGEFNDMIQEPFTAGTFDKRTFWTYSKRNHKRLLNVCLPAGLPVCCESFMTT